MSENRPASEPISDAPLPAELPPPENVGLIYLASPYSHEDTRIRDWRFDVVCRAAARLMSQGYLVFSPIAHTHPIAMHGKLPTGWDFWRRYDHAQLDAADEMWILRVDCWDQSKGVAGEIEYMTKRGKRIRYVDPTPEDLATPPSGEIERLTREVSPAEQFLRTLPAAKAGQASEEVEIQRFDSADASEPALPSEAEYNRSGEQAIWDRVQELSPWCESNDMPWCDEILCGLVGVEQKIATLTAERDAALKLAAQMRANDSEQVARSDALYRQTATELAALAELERKMREALEFYANEEHYDDNGSPGIFVCAGGDYGGKDEWQEDRGAIARAALASPAPAAKPARDTYEALADVAAQLGFPLTKENYAELRGAACEDGLIRELGAKVAAEITRLQERLAEVERERDASRSVCQNTMDILREANQKLAGEKNERGIADRAATYWWRAYWELNGSRPVATDTATQAYCEELDALHERLATARRDAEAAKGAQSSGRVGRYYCVLCGTEMDKDDVSQHRCSLDASPASTPTERPAT